MQYAELLAQALRIKRKYAELNAATSHRRWGAAEYTQGFVGDVGDLVKLIMARNHFRPADDVEPRIAHELSDCLWSVLVLADELGVDLETEFTEQMTDLEHRITAALERVRPANP